VQEIVHSGRVSVFRINGPLDPNGCGKPANRRGSKSKPGGSTESKQ